MTTEVDEAVRPVFHYPERPLTSWTAYPLPSP